jgi:hypothetical protein
MNRGTERGNDQADALDRLSTAADTSFFFVGSSRVQRSIDPKIINAHYDGFRTVNLGISSGNFLSSCVMANFILRQRGHKVVFIELAPLLDELPDGLFKVSSETGLSPFRSVLDLTGNHSFSERSMLIVNIINHHLYNSITVREEVREIFGYKMDDSDQLIGFQSSDKNDAHDISSFLTWQEINTNRSNAIDLTKYKTMIGHLENLAKSNNSRIVFFLPVTYNKQIEKSIAISLYQVLPYTMKLEFSAHFLEQMARKEFLMDGNHLNAQGATAYSRLLIPLLEKYSDKK